MKMINNIFTLVVALFFLASCGSEPKQTSEPTQAEEIKEKPLEEFTIRAVGNLSLIHI